MPPPKHVYHEPVMHWRLSCYGDTCWCMPCTAVSCSAVGWYHFPYKSGKKSLCSDGDPDRHHNLIICSLALCQPSLKISCKSIPSFCAKLLTDKQRRKHILLGGGKNTKSKPRSTENLNLELLMCVGISLCTTVIHNIAQNSSIIFRLVLRTFIIAQKLPAGGEGKKKKQGTWILSDKLPLQSLKDILELGVI